MRIFIVAFGLLLAGCDDLPKAHSRNEINEIVREETGYLTGNDRRLLARIEELENEVSSLKRDIAYLD
jgi:hypothetical protein